MTAAEVQVPEGTVQSLIESISSRVSLHGAAAQPTGLMGNVVLISRISSRSNKPLSESQQSKQ